MPDAISEAIKAIGLGPFSESELKAVYNDLCQGIDIGLHRNGPPTQRDGGVLTLRTKVPLLTQDTWGRVPSGSETLVCASGGTSWTVGYAMKETNGTVSVRVLSRHSILAVEGHYIFEGFVRLMAKTIIKSSMEHNLTHVSTIAVSLGFPLINEKTEYGIEGSLTTAFVSKGWEIDNWDEREEKRLGKALIEQINESQILHIDKVVFLNDTCAVALDIGSVADDVNQGMTLLPVGMICGTGTNICIGDDGEAVNLEIGEARVIREDAIMTQMLAKDLVPSPLLIEYYTGMFIPWRLGIALELLEERGLLRGGKALGNAIHAAEGAMLSKLASGQISAEDLREKWKLPIKADTLATLQSLAQQALYKAGQVYGLLLSSAVQQVRKAGPPMSQGYVVLAEGSVLHEGYRMKEVTEKVCQQLGQPRTIISKSSSLAGAATLAMSLKYIV